MKAKEYFELWSPATNHATPAAIQMQMLDSFSKELHDVAHQRGYKAFARDRLAREFSDKWDAVAALFEKSGKTVLEPGAFAKYYLEKHPSAKSDLKPQGVRLPSIAQYRQAMHPSSYDREPASTTDYGHPTISMRNPNALVTLMMLGRMASGN